MSMPKAWRLAHLVSSLIDGDEACDLRKKLVRWLHASVAITYQAVSQTYKLKFPSLLSLEGENLLTPKEREHLEPLGSFARSQVLLAWFMSAVREHDRTSGEYIGGRSMLPVFYDELMSFSGNCSRLRLYNARPIPLGYSQIISLCVYTYFIFTLVARQHHGNGAFDSIPICTVIQFIVYVGWLKVAEEMLYPFGDDDDVALDDDKPNVPPELEYEDPDEEIDA